MINRNLIKNTTVPDPSVAADGGQPHIPDTTTIITDPTQLDKCSGFPEILKQEGRFCCWRYEDRNGNKTKVPYNPVTGERARSNAPDSFTDYESVAQIQGYNGIGIGIFDEICAIDLDNCISESGEWSPIATDIVTTMHSYTELSPSGKGLHILFRAAGFSYDVKRYYIMNHKSGIEVYVAGATSKYVTVTGNSCTNFEYGERSNELQQVLERYMQKPLPTSETHAVNAINAVNSFPDAESLLKKAASSRNGAEFTKLWNGTIDGYPSHSEADLALCSQLAFWTGKNPSEMDQLFRQSALMREKWDRPQAGSTYGAITIQKAIDACHEVYTPSGKEPSFQAVTPLTPQSANLPAFPLDALPPSLREYVSAVAEHSQTSPDMAAVIGLGVLAVCLQGKFVVQGMPGYFEPLSLYTVVIAAPGERKSSVMRDMTGCLREYEDEYNRSRDIAIRANKQTRASLSRQITGLQKKLENKPDRLMELELQQLEGELEETPELKHTRFFADDCSSEALTSLMSANNGVLSVISTEGGIFDIMAGRYSNKVNIDIWLKGHCGDAVYVDRTTRESEWIPHPTLSAILSIQPAVLNEIMSNVTMAGRGLIARFLYSSPPSLIGTRSFQTPSIPPETAAAYRSMIYRFMAIPADDNPRILKLTTSATSALDAHFHEHEQYLTGEGQAILDWASKYIGAILRIAGLIHIADTNAESLEIPVETIRRAIQIGQYFLAHAAYAYSMMGTDLSIQKAKFVLAKLKKKSISEIKRSDLFQICRGRFFRQTNELFPTLELLEDHGYIRTVQPEQQTAGRPADVRIHVNPKA